MVDVDYLIQKLDKAGNRLNIIILDACRNDPFSRGVGGGLAPINNAKGMYIAFATAPGEVASDGDDRNGLFTKYLIKYIQTPNLTLDEVFNKGEVILFGSRVNDNKRGGDIDLYIKAEYDFEKKIRFLAKLKSRIGDRKIDVVFNINSNRLIEKEANCGITIYSKKS